MRCFSLLTVKDNEAVEQWSRGAPPPLTFGTVIPFVLIPRGAVKMPMGLDLCVQIAVQKSAPVHSVTYST